MERLVFLTHLGSTLAMVGVIWVIQWVHYPLFEQVGESTWGLYHRAHVQRITAVVGPLMLLEIGTGLFFLARPWGPISTPAAWLGMGLIGLIWVTTALLSVPMHDALAGGFLAREHALLVGTNWIRTLAWTARGGLVLVWLHSWTLALP